MSEKSTNPEKTDNRRYDPELLKQGLRCELDQYDILKRCSGAGGVKNWNGRRKTQMEEEVFLEGAIFCKVNLEGVDFRWAYLKNADFALSHLEDANFDMARINNATFNFAFVNSETSFIGCCVGRKTDFRGVSLNIVRIKQETKQLLEYNIRRMNWDQWYPKHSLLRWPVRWFWCISDYGRSTWRIIAWFFGLAFVFALIYRLLPTCVSVEGFPGDIRGFWHVFYFSVVTMTTLGFGDIAANPDSWLGQTLLLIQVILGYVLLGALITRFAVLFTAGGPAGEFADKKEKKGYGEKTKKE